MRKLNTKLILLLPILYMILLSVFSYFKFPALLPKNFSLMYWEDVFLNNPLFVKALFNSLILSTMTALMSTSIGFVTGRAVVKYFGGYSKKVALLISIPLMIPGMILFIGMHQVLIILKLSYTYLSVILVHTVICLPYTTNIAIAYFTGIPNEYEEISLTLGASKITTFRKIMMPMLFPGISTAMLISFLISNTEYFSTFLVGGGQIVTLSMIMFPYIGQGEYGHSAVMGLIFISLHLCLFAIVDRLVKKDIHILYGGQ